VFALPSLHEPYGMVYGEALSAGLPIVGFQSGNLPNLIRHGVEGLLVPPRDVDVLAHAFGRLAEDEGLRRGLANAAALTATHLPSWEQSAQRFFDAVHAALLHRVKQ